ncbi:MAG: WhiB family transcriptional regulator [Ilumatobacteraceae bacterium]
MEIKSVVTGGRGFDQTNRWRQRARCVGATQLFFAPPLERPEAKVRREARARAVCESCEVMYTCRAVARVNREYEFWGGESEAERHLAGFTVAAPTGVSQAARVG